MTRTLPSPRISKRPLRQHRPDLLPADAKAMLEEMIDLLPEALVELRWMYDLAWGSRSGGRNGPPPRTSRDEVGPPTPEAWGEVPGDLAGIAASNGHYRAAYKVMARSLREARSSLLKIITTSERTIGEATTSGSSLPDMRADKLGRVEYEELARMQARRRMRGEL